MAQDPGSKARLGRLTTPHGVIETPVFMPVGTQATVKAVSPVELRELKASIILSNSYHMLIRPGLEVIREMGGLHRFMGWDGPVLTDSGGYQVFSLAKLRKITPDGVKFQSHIDGANLFIGPKEAVQIQRTLGSDIMMAFDECPPWPAEKEKVRAAVDRTLRWAELCRQEQELQPPGPTPGQKLFAIVQGGEHADLRRECAERLTALDFPGYAIGGVSVGEPEPEMLKAIEVTEPWLPAHKPRYAMGLGQPHQIVKIVARGVDMFDCVLPTRVARNGTAYTRQGTLNLKRSGLRCEKGPIESACGCYACQNFSRAYIRHLLKAEEILGLRLVTLHNLHFYINMMREMREAIALGSFGVWSREFLEQYKPREEHEHVDEQS
ncbi:MAG: tRNA guanosine(34) transglycosylase Tgt [Methylacidiphilales bacterium]|nr:tRNA guanosine(34) transglycosylase Tgt [Candidatus Methylacidiphilales bacterium]